MRARTRLAFPIASLAFFFLLALAHTWPLASAPGRWSRNDTADTVHHEWILAWDAHQLARDPRHLFDANIFYPEPDTLAYSDHLIVQGAMGAPFFWLGASPVLVYNLLLIGGLTLTAWTTSLVMARWTGSRLAGLFSGSLLAFNAMTLTRFAEIQDQHFEFFPLALWSLDLLLSTPRVRYALQLAGWFVLQALTCGYLLVFMSLSLVAAVAVRPKDWIGGRFRQVASLLALAASVAALVLVPFLLPYLRVSRQQGFTRPMAEVALYSARLADYVSTGGRLHYSLWSARFFDREALFPGLVASIFVVVAIASGVAWRDRRARMAIAFGIVAFALSFGPAFPLYEPVARIFPIMAGLRGASRFGQFVLAAVAILAGFGLAFVSQRFPRRAVALGAIVLFGANLEALRAPINYRVFDSLSPVFDNLADTNRALVACFPLPPRREAFHNVDCMLASTRFWHPLINGYSSFIPERYDREAAALDAFPEGTTLQYLRQLGVTHVIVFTNQLSAPRLAHLAEHPELSLWKEDRDKAVRIYELKR
jgi:uncharacterized membrane protein SirB2